jgi:hypothetical protein
MPTTTPSEQRIACYCVCCESERLLRSPAILMPFIAARIFNWYPVEIDDSWGLKTIQKGTAYSICNSLLCEDCGLLFMDMRFSDAELGKLYSDYRGKEYSELREQFEPGYISRNNLLNEGVPFLAKIEEFIRPHLHFPIAILDWGGDTGNNTPFKEENCLFHIYDISNKPVIEGAVAVDAEKAALTDYQLIICSQVLEHTPYPAKVIESMKLAMSADTLLYIDVPYEEYMRNSAPENILTKKKHWHEHINFYSTKSLRILMQSCGLRVLDENTLFVTGREKEVAMLQIICRLK